MRRALRLVTGNLVVLVGIFVLLEGCASLLLFARDVRWELGQTKGRHTRYDPELGWVNLPNLAIRDLYGPRRSLHTNDRGFRALTPASDRVAPGQRRAICSGDSFTFGYGVDDRQVWCHLLARMTPGLETVNLAIGGYGVGQSYLRYKRDAQDLAHQVHLFAFIENDFRRLQLAEHWGYAKPLLGVEDDALVVRNLPLPRGSYLPRWYTQALGQLQRLQLTQLAQRARPWLGLRPPVSEGELSPEDARQVVRLVFRDLRRLSRERSSQLVLIFLPSALDYRGEQSLEWIEFVRQEAVALDVPFLDLIAGFRGLPAREADRLFIKPGELTAPSVAWHYNAAGNRYVAEQVSAKLRETSGVREALGLGNRSRASFPPGRKLPTLPHRLTVVRYSPDRNAAQATSK